MCGDCGLWSYGEATAQLCKAFGIRTVVKRTINLGDFEYADELISPGPNNTAFLAALRPTLWYVRYRRQMPPIIFGATEFAAMNRLVSTSVSSITKSLFSAVLAYVPCYRSILVTLSLTLAMIF